MAYSEHELERMKASLGLNEDEPEEEEEIRIMPEGDMKMEHDYRTLSKIMNMKEGDPIITKKELPYGYDLNPNTAYKIVEVKISIKKDLLQLERMKPSGKPVRDVEKMHTEFKFLDDLVFTLFDIRGAHASVEGPGAQKKTYYPLNYFDI